MFSKGEIGFGGSEIKSSVLTMLEFPDGLAVKDSVLSLLWLGLLLCLRFDSWPRNFCMPWAWPKKAI